MAKYELAIYKGQQVEKTYTANFCPWGLYVEAVDVQDHLNKMTGKEIVKSLEGIMLALFDGLTSEEMQRTDGAAVMSLFLQIVQGDAGNGSKAIKNA